MKKLLFNYLIISSLYVSASGSVWLESVGKKDNYADLSKITPSSSVSVHPYGAPFAPWVAWEIQKCNSSCDLELHVALPEGARTLGVWFKGLPGDRLSFVLRAPDGEKVSFLEGEEEGRSQKYRFNSYSPPAVIDSWTMRQIYLHGVPDGTLLECIKISGSREGKRAISGLHVSKQNPSRKAQWLWKVKDFDPTRPSSITWTAIEYYEYGWERDAVLRSCGWIKMLGEPSLSSLDVVMKAMDGQVIWRKELTGRQLQKDLELPRLSEGTYFLDLTARNSRGVFLKEGRFVYQVLRQEQEVDSLPGIPTLISLHNETGAPKLTVGAETAVTFFLTQDQGERQPRKIIWKLTEFDGAQIRKGEDELVEGRAEIHLQAPYEGVFSFHADLLNEEGERVGRFSELLGTYPVPRKETHPLEEPASQNVFSLSLMSSHYDPLLIPRLPIDTLPDLVTLTKDAGMTPGFIVKWNEFEPLRGMYQWNLTDRLIKMAKASGQPTWMGVGFTGDTLPEWLWFEELMDQDQMTIQASYHYVTPFGPNFTAAQETMLRNLITHYRTNNDVQGYIVYAGPSEGFLTDTPPSISDYSPAAREAFRVYMRKICDDNIVVLNRRWDTTYTDWSEMDPPQPDWSLQWECSTAWLDFHHFKSDFVVERLTALTRLAREADPKKPMMAYGKEGFGSTGRLARIFSESNFRYTNGGGEMIASYVQTCIMRNHHVAANPEGHYVMPNFGSVVMVAANSIWAGGYEGQNIMWGLVWAKTPHVGVREYAEIAKLGAALQAHEEDLFQTTALQPWAAYFGGLQSMLLSRSFRTALYPEVVELMQAAGEGMHNLCSWVDDDSSLEAMSAYRVLVDSGAKVLERESLGRLLQYVRAGGILVASTETARYLAGEEEEANALVSLLGGESVSVGGNKSVRSAQGNFALKSLDTIAWKSDSVAKPMITDDHGRTLLYSVPEGQGKVFLASGKIDFRQSTSFLQQIIDEGTASRIPYQWEGEGVTVRPLSGREADYLPFILWTPDRGLNHPIETLEKLPTRPVKITNLPLSLREVTELISGRKIAVVEGTISDQFMPGMLYILKIPKETSSLTSKN